MALATVLALGGLVLGAGCSASGSPLSAQSRCPTAEGVTAKNVQIGLLYPDSGPNSQVFGPYRSGIDARLGVANAQGGVDGRTISYAWADDQGSAEGNLAAARHLVNTQRVFAIQEFSPSPEGSAAWLNQEGIPVVGTSDAAVWTKYRNMFSYLNIITSSGSVGTWGDYATQAGVKTAAVLYSPFSDGSRNVAAAFRQSFANVGVSTSLIAVEPASMNTTAVVKQLQESGAEMIAGVLDGDAFFRIAIAAHSTLPAVKFMSIVGYDPAILKAGPLLAGMTIFTAYTPFEHPVPAHRTFLSAMTKYAPQQQPAADADALAGWMDADLLLAGIRGAGPCLTRATLMTGLRHITHYDAGGLLAAPVDIGTEFGELTQCYWFLQISADGKRFNTIGNKPRCGRRL